MYVEWLRRGPCYVVKCLLLLQLICRTTGAGCSVDHSSGMNYPTTTASGTWTNRGGISSYGWDSRQPIDPCSRCTNVPPPLPGSQYTTQSHRNSYGANDRISVNDHLTDNRVTTNSYLSDNHVSGYVSDNRIIGYINSPNKNNIHNPDYPVNSYSNHMNGRPNSYNSNIYSGNGYISGTNNAGNTHFTDNYVNIHSENQIRNPDYRGNGYDNLSPEWNKRHGNKKGGGVSGTGSGYNMGTNYIVGSGYNVGDGIMGVGGNMGGISGDYNQGMAYPVVNILNGQGSHEQGNYPRPSNDRWNIKGSYPVKVENGYWQSHPPKDIGWDEDSKKVGVIAGWIGGSKKHESTNNPSLAYNSHQTSDKDDVNFNKGTGYDSYSDKKKPYMGWGGSGSYEVIKMNNGYKYIDRNSNSEYSSNNYGNNYGYGGQSYNYNSKPGQDYGSKPINVGGHNKPYNYEVPNHDKPTHGNNKHPDETYNKPLTHEYGSRPSTIGYDKPPAYDYGTRPPGAQEWSTLRPIGFEVTTSRPPVWNPQKPSFPGQIASRPTQHWGENSFNEQLGGGNGLMEYNRPGSNNNLGGPGSYLSSRPDYGYGNSRPDHSYSSLRPDHSYGSSRPDHSYGSSRPDHSYGSSPPDHNYIYSKPEYNYGSSRPGGGGTSDYGNGRPYVGSIHQMSSNYGSQTSNFDKFGGFSDNGSGSSWPQMNNQPNYDNNRERPFMNGNDVYGSQHQSQSSSGQSKGYASNWDYYSNSMRGPPSSASSWNEQPLRYDPQKRPDGDAFQSSSNFRPSESTPLHYNGHSGIGASTDNGFLYRNPSTVSSSSTTAMPTTDS